MKDIIILAAGSLRNKIHFVRYYFESPALVPINVKYLVSYSLDFYLSQEDVRIHLVVNKSECNTVKRELGYYGDMINYICVDPTKGVVDTLRNAIDKMPKDAEDVTVNLVTTIPNCMPKQNEVFISNRLQKTNNWSTVSKKGNRPRN